MSERLRLALVGCGLHSAAHVRACINLPHLVRMTTVCDLNDERARNSAVELGDVKIETDYEKVLADPGIDAVLLCLPHDQHAPAAVAAAEAGKHILVEKPISRTLAEADAMIDAARRADVTLMVAHHQRYMTENQRIKALIDEGAIGAIYWARADNHMDFRPPASHWIRNAHVTGGGAMIGYGVHRIDLLRWLVGEIVEVSHFQTHRPDRFEGEAVGATILKFANGAIGEISVNWVVGKSPWMDLTYLCGEHGTIHNAGGLHLHSSRSSGSHDDFRPVPLDEADPTTAQMEHFARSVLDGSVPLTSGIEARRTLEVCLAAYRSAETGDVVRLPIGEQSAAS